MKVIYVIVGNDTVPLAAYNNHEAALAHFKYLQKKESCILFSLPIDFEFIKKEWE